MKFIRDIRKGQYPKLIFGYLILIKRLFCLSREIASQVKSPLFKHCESMFIELCDKTIYLPYLVLLTQPSTLTIAHTHTHTKIGAGGTNFVE